MKLGKKENKKVQVKEEDNELKYSLKRVVKRGIQNIKDDIDPIRNGVKGGFFAFHGIPTWKRQYDEGRMRGGGAWSRISGAATGLTVGTAYALGTNVAVQEHGNQGYAVLGIPVAAQVGSYVFEAFKRGKKDELEELVMTRINKAISNEDSAVEYDLTIKDLITSIAKNEINKEIQVEVKDIERLKSNYLAQDDNRMSESKFKRTTDYHQQRIKAFESSDYLGSMERKAHNIVLEAAAETFDGLMADDSLGKKYELSQNIRTGPLKRKADKRRKQKRSYYQYGEKSTGFLQDIIKQTVEENKGSANIELFGNLSAVYGGRESGVVHYQVNPNELWKW